MGTIAMSSDGFTQETASLDRGSHLADPCGETGAVEILSYGFAATISVGTTRLQNTLVSTAGRTDPSGYEDDTTR